MDNEFKIGKELKVYNRSHLQECVMSCEREYKRRSNIDKVGPKEWIELAKIVIQLFGKLKLRRK